MVLASVNVTGIPHIVQNYCRHKLPQQRIDDPYKAAGISVFQQISLHDSVVILHKCVVCIPDHCRLQKPGQRMRLAGPGIIVIIQQKTCALS